MSQTRERGTDTTHTDTHTRTRAVTLIIRYPVETTCYVPSIPRVHVCPRVVVCDSPSCSASRARVRARPASPCTAAATGSASSSYGPRATEARPLMREHRPTGRRGGEERREGGREFNSDTERVSRGQLAFDSATHHGGRVAATNRRPTSLLHVQYVAGTLVQCV